MLCRSAVRGRGDRVETLARRGAQVAVTDQQAQPRKSATSHPPTQLVQLGDTEAVRVHQHHRSGVRDVHARSEEHTSELQSLMRISYAVFCLKKKTQTHRNAIVIP